MKSLKFLTTICLAVLLSFSAVPAMAKQEVKLAMEEITGSVQDIYAQYFKKRIAETIPDWDLQIYPLGPLGDASDLAEQVMNGVIEFDMPCSHLGSFVPMVRIISMPYIWSNDMEVNKKLMLDSPSLYGIMGDAYAKNNMKLLGIFPEGWQYWSSNKPLRTLADFDKLRIRVMSDPLLAEIYKNYGANPLHVSYAEIFSALQLKQLDANIQPLFAHEEMSFYEQQQYFTNPFEMPFISTFVANKNFFDGLSKEQQDAVVKAAREATEYTFGEIEKIAEERKAKMLQKKPDLVFTELTPEEQQPFREKGLLVEKTFIKMVGPDGEKLLNGLKAEVKELEGKK